MAQINTIFSGSRFIFKALVISFVLCALWLLLNLKALREYIDTNAQRRAEQEQIDVLKRRIENLHAQQLSLVSGGIETERQVRERFHMHKPGEQVIFLEEEATHTSSTTMMLPDAASPDGTPADATTTAPTTKRQTTGVSAARPGNAPAATSAIATTSAPRRPTITTTPTPSRAPSSTLPAPGSPRVNRLLLNENGARAD